MSTFKNTGDFVSETIFSVASGRMPRFKKSGRLLFIIIFILGIIGVFYFYLIPDCPNCGLNIDLSGLSEEENDKGTYDTLKIEDFQKEETSGSSEENENLYLVSRVVDGDTFEIASGQKVRMIGIDTPETVDPNREDECYGQEASDFLKNLIEGRQVKLTKDVSETDKYGRILAYVYLKDLFVNEYLVNEGYAEATPYPPDVKYQELLGRAETSARAGQRGLWGTTCNTISLDNIQGIEDTKCKIKGNISWSGEKIYHLPECSYYGQTQISEETGEKYFCTEEEAIQSGYRKALNCP